MTKEKTLGTPTIGRIVSIAGAIYAVLCHDGNGPVGTGTQNDVGLVPMNSEKFAEVADPLAAGFYRVRVARLMAAGWGGDNETATRALVPVIAHPNSTWMGDDIDEALESTGDGQTRKGLSTRGVNYIGQRVGGASSPLGWTLVYWDGTYTPYTEAA